MSDAKFDSKRRLCPDGSCIGVIGPDGRCSECGRAAGATPAAASASVEASSTWDDEAREKEAADEAAEEPAKEAMPGGGFDPKRRLCDDGSCVGIVGSDGRCSVCGLAAA